MFANSRRSKTLTGVFVALLVLVPAAAAGALTGAIYTTDQTCTTVNENVHYADRQSVYLDGGPQNEEHGSGLPEGDYWVRVTEPDGTILGTSPSANVHVNADGFFADENDEPACYQLWSVLNKQSDGTQGYDLSSNNGDEYKAWASSGSDFDNNESKTDNFKVFYIDPCIANPNAEGCGGAGVDCIETPDDPECVLDPLTVDDLDSLGDPTLVWQWNIDKKAVDPDDIVKGVGTVTINYTVDVTSDGYVLTDLEVTGSATVGNSNSVAVALEAADVSVTTEDPDVDCAFDNTFPVPVPANATATITYTCSVPDQIVNTTTVEDALEYLPVLVTVTIGDSELESDVPWLFNEFNSFNVTPAAEDSFNDLEPTALPLVDDGDGSFSASYSRIVTVGTGCTTYTNVATVDEQYADSAATEEDSIDVQACGPASNLVGHTIGFWSNKNGQALITTGAATSGVCNSGTALRVYKPFQDLSATATCSQVASYAAKVIKAANASGASMNAMLKAQMMATSLSVSLFGLSPTAVVDLDEVCPTAGGCTTPSQDSSPAFGGATSLTVGAVLTYAASQATAATPTAPLASPWYAQVKGTQELAKDVFDAINNGVAFAP